MIVNYFQAFYVDPGAGALVWQLLVAALLGGVFYLRKFRDSFSVKNLFSGKKKDAPTVADLPDGDADVAERRREKSEATDAAPTTNNPDRK